MGCVQIILCNSKNVMSLNNLLLNLYFENLIIELHIVYAFNIHIIFF